MKSLLPLLCALAVAVTTAGHADAASGYANNYVGFWYQHGSVVGGVNVTVDEAGNVTGHGAYLDLTEIHLTGTVSDSGTLSLTETDGSNAPFSFTALFKSRGGKKFSGRSDDGYVFRAKRIAGDFTQAGVYSLRDDIDEDGVVFINRGGVLYGVIYGNDGYPYELDGGAGRRGFDATSEDGVDYSADFDGYGYSGSYDDGGDFYGDFNGSKY